MNPLLLCLILLGRQNRLWNEQSARSKKGKLEEIEINPLRKSLFNFIVINDIIMKLSKVEKYHISQTWF